jgi:hypothetical protein
MVILGMGSRGCPKSIFFQLQNGTRAVLQLKIFFIYWQGAVQKERLDSPFTPFIDQKKNNSQI